MVPPSSIRLRSKFYLVLTASNLPLALNDTLKRMPMFAGKGDHLCRLCFSYFMRVSSALGDSFIVNAEHERHCTFTIHPEEPFYSVHDKLHWSIIVVQDQHAPCRALGGIELGHLLSPGSRFRNAAMNRLGKRQLQCL